VGAWWDSHFWLSAPRFRDGPFCLNGTFLPSTTYHRLLAKLRKVPMKKLLALRGMLALLLLVTILAVIANAQAPPLDSIKSQEELDKVVTSLDAALFDAYNRCDLEKFSSFFVDDVEFYHDQGGVTLGRQNLTDSVKKNICGKVTRELVPGTLQVYYMKGYGAVEMGVHRFHHPGHEDTEGVGEGKFIHLWQYKDGAWKITRVISYDHHAAKSPNSRAEQAATP
jgi:hypothetical protein